LRRPYAISKRKFLLSDLLARSAAVFVAQVSKPAQNGGIATIYISKIGFADF
jgi:hypothetical protein